MDSGIVVTVFGESSGGPAARALGLGRLVRADRLAPF